MAKSIKLKNDIYLDLTSIVIPTGTNWSATGQVPIKVLKMEEQQSRNFNDYQNTGIYYLVSAPISYGFSNAPANVTGTLVVLRATVFTYQIYFTHSDGLYYRGCYDNTWSTWRHL